MADEVSIFLSPKLLSSLQGLPSNVQSGYLHSFLLRTSEHFVSCSLLPPRQDFGHVYDCVKQSLPAGIRPAGVFIGGIKTDRVEIERHCRVELRDAIEHLGDNSQVYILALGQQFGTEAMKLFAYDIENQNCTKELQFKMGPNILDKCMFMRLRAKIPIDKEYTDNREIMNEEMATEIGYLKEELRCPTTAFLVDNSNLVLFYSEDASNKNYTCKEVVNHIQKEEEGDFYEKKNKASSPKSIVINMSLLCQRTGEVASSRSASCAPVIRHTHKSFSNLHMTLAIDVVGYIHPDTLTDYVTYTLVEAMCDQLDAHIEALKNQADVHTPVPFHFKPDWLDHVISVSYPLGVVDDNLVKEREEYHTIFNLPKDIPHLRRSNKYILPDEVPESGYLINPHIGLSKSGEGCVSLVRGNYAYHHYMQDHMNDNGWGCAYRSLQTIFSWFRMQGYTENVIPTHKEIQQVLVDIGDKPATFVGTKQWIGSTEVNYVLNHLLGITSKIMFVSSGAELETKGRELALHFDTQGTPIMIGGGVLAHTILGVDFNEMTGDLKFLILDPHYTGGEDLKIIQGKGWCGWKGPDFWDKKAYYNLCMPQRPLVL